MNLVDLAIIKYLMVGQYQWAEHTNEEWRNIGSTFKSWRQKQGITLKNSSSAIAVSPVTLTKFESGKFTKLRTYINIWYRLLLAEKTKEFKSLCRRNM